MTPDQEIYRANRAKEVLDNEAYQEAFASMRQEIVNQWESSPARDTEGRESLWVMLKQLDKLQATLQTTMQAGNLAAANLRHLQTRKESIDALRLN